MTAAAGAEPALPRVRPERPLRASATTCASSRRATTRGRALRSTTSSTASGCTPGMLAAALGGLDAFVFTAGIGENSPRIRARIAERLAWLGAELDPAANAAGASSIAAPGSRVGSTSSDRRGADDRAPHPGAATWRSTAEMTGGAEITRPRYSNRSTWTRRVVLFLVIGLVLCAMIDFEVMAGQ